MSKPSNLKLTLIGAATILVITAPVISYLAWLSSKPNGILIFLETILGLVGLWFFLCISRLVGGSIYSLYKKHYP